MKWKQYIFSILLLFCITALFYAQENKDLVFHYDSEIVKINYGLWSGLTLNYQGRNYSPVFGLDKHFKTTLSMDPDVKRYVDEYTSQNRTGHVLLWGGLAAILAAPLLINYNSLSESSYDSNPVTAIMPPMILMGIGSLCTLISPFFLTGSYETLINGVHTYNRNKWLNYQKF